MASSQFNVVKNNLEGTVYRGDLNNVITGGVYSVTGSNITNRPAENRIHEKTRVRVMERMGTNYINTRNLATYTPRGIWQVQVLII